MQEFKVGDLVMIDEVELGLIAKHHETADWMWWHILRQGQMECLVSEARLTKMNYNDY